MSQIRKQDSLLSNSFGRFMDSWKARHPKREELLPADEVIQ